MFIHCSAQSITVELTVTDESGNNDNCSFILNAVDLTPPVVICQDFTVLLDENEEASIDISDIDGGTTDNCSLDMVEISTADFDISNLGENNVILTATDAVGNVSTCESIVTVILTDSLAPTAICQDLILELNSSGEVMIDVTDIDGGSFDNINLIDLEINMTSFNCEDVGDNTVILTVTDESENIDTCESIVTIEDNIGPEITGCPADDFVQVNSNCEYVIGDYSQELIIVDNCTSLKELTVEQVPAPGTIFTGSQQVECLVSVTDAAGNITQCEFSLIISDQTAPVIDCTDILTVSSNSGCEYEVEPLEEYITISDDCSANLTIIQSPAVGEIISESTMAELTVIDETGNSASCQFLLEVVNGIPPSVTCPSDQLLELKSNCVAILPDYTQDAISEAHCGSEIISVTQAPEPGAFITESTLMTITASDSEGNTSSCEFMVEVLNTVLPSIECPINYIAEMEENCSITVPDFTSALQITTQCGSSIISVVQEPQPGEIVSDDQLISITVTDSEGNVTGCEFEIILIDTTAPLIECQENIEQSDSLVIYDLPDFSDNCDAEIQLNSGLESGSIFPHGSTEVSYIVEDLAGNIDSCTFSVLVNNDPIALNDTIFVANNASFHLDSILINDYDPDGDLVTVRGWFNENPNLTIDITEDGEISIGARDNWCGIDSIQYTICDEFGACSEAYVLLEIECIDMVIPNGFSPNGDGVNDVLEIVGLELYPDNKIEIYSRWGRKIYEQESYQNDWNGIPLVAGFLGGDRVPVGTYFMVLDLGDGRPLIQSSIYIRY